MKLFTTSAGSYLTALYLSSETVVVGTVESASQVVNEDGSGDAILFENGDTWVTE